MKTFFRLLLSAGFLVALTGSRALACAACYNANTGSRMGNAANWGVIAMVIIMFIMLGAIVAAGFYLNYRAKHPFPDYEELLSDNETLPDPAP
jgi:hypothetical protein